MAINGMDRKSLKVPMKMDLEMGLARNFTRKSQKKVSNTIFPEFFMTRKGL